MELRHFEYLVAVAEEQSFTRAAARVHVAQPGVSAQIRQLEAELGQALFDRSGRHITLTDAGAAVLPFARAALGAAAGAKDVVDQLTGLVRGHVTIGTVTSIAAEGFDFAGLLAEFHRDHPDVEITLAAANSDELIAGLRAGVLDLALIGLGYEVPDGLALHVIAEERLVAAVAHDHPLANKSTVALRALARQRLISLPRGTGLRSCLDDAFAAAGLAPRISLEAGDPRLLAELAAKGLGVAVVPRSITDARPDKLCGIEIVRPTLCGRIALAWRKDASLAPAARHLVERMRQSSTAHLGDPEEKMHPNRRGEDGRHGR